MEDKLEEARRLGIVRSDRIKVELHDGTELIGSFDIHPLADCCVKNQHGFPINYKKIIQKL